MRHFLLQPQSKTASFRAEKGGGGKECLYNLGTDFTSSYDRRAIGQLPGSVSAIPQR
jgi:hypothetical protein